MIKNTIRAQVQPLVCWEEFGYQLKCDALIKIIIGYRGVALRLKRPRLNDKLFSLDKRKHFKRAHRHEGKINVKLTVNGSSASRPAMAITVTILRRILLCNYY